MFIFLYYPLQTCLLPYITSCRRVYYLISPLADVFIILYYPFQTCLSSYITPCKRVYHFIFPLCRCVYYLIIPLLYVFIILYYPFQTCLLSYVTPFICVYYLILSLSDVFAVKSVCPGRSSLTLQLGMLKKKSRGKTSWRMDLKIHQDLIQEDCFILTKWEKDAQKVNTRELSSLVFGIHILRL